MGIDKLTISIWDPVPWRSDTVILRNFCFAVSLITVWLTDINWLYVWKMHVMLTLYQIMSKLHQTFTLKNVSRPKLCKSNVNSETEFIFTARGYAKRGICRRRVSVCVCVCVPVCLSVTLRYCIKTAKHRITQTTPHDSPMTLVSWRQRSWRNSNGITPYWGDKCRWGGLKLVSFDEKRAITQKRYKIDV